MLILLSPTKTMNLSSETESYGTQPELITQAHTLINKLKKLSEGDVAKLMTMSESITAKSRAEYQSYSLTPSDSAVSSAVLTYSGEAYRAMQATDWSETTRTFADKHLRILSGLYGMLRPSDGIQPYRLEMAAKIKPYLGETLYQYWSDTLTLKVNAILSQQENPILINLASKEYSKVITKALKYPLINLEFKENRNGKLKVISFNAKQARGRMTDYIMSNQIDSIQGIKKFDRDDYTLHPKSTDTHLLFVRN